MEGFSDSIAKQPCRGPNDDHSKEQPEEELVPGLEESLKDKLVKASDNQRSRYRPDEGMHPSEQGGHNGHYRPGSLKGGIRRQEADVMSVKRPHDRSAEGRDR